MALKIEFLNPSGVMKPMGYTQAVKVTAPSAFLFISGQVGVDEKGNVVAAGDLEKQTRQTMKNIGKILESVGASFKDLVALTIYTPRIGDMAIIREVRAEFLNKDNPPAITSVGVTGLAREEYLVEIEAIAAFR